MPYNFKDVEESYSKKFVEIFQKHMLEQAKEGKKKFYCLEMFPYPSGRLHMGHVRNYTIGDAIARYKRLCGFDVFYPMGYDSFGLPAENAAIKHGIHPKKWTEDCISTMKQQQMLMGYSYDWSKELATHKPEYYKWNQYFFIKFLEKGIAYRKNAPANYCPSCQTVLANEQVENGKCWRCHSKVEIRQMEQWFFKITDYADRLLEGLERIDWPERIKEMQRNWIGKSSGTLVKFKLDGMDKELEVFTTRVDTIFGVTFLAMAPEHPLALELARKAGKEKEREVKEFIDKVLVEERFERTSIEKSKEGIFLDAYAIHPFTKEKIPIYVASFVLPDYGTGIVMGVPAHDARDFEFAKQHGLSIKHVVLPKDASKKLDEAKAFEEFGILADSEEFSGMSSEQAIEEITKKLEKLGLGKKAVCYKLRDWLISRQRYWGTPIPVVYCQKCGIQPVSIDELPVILPEDVKFGRGNPLATNESWLNTTCPKCKGPARRETDTMDTFVDSSWYFLRYVDNKNDAEPFDKKKVSELLPVDIYIGGAEHATMHLIYARFFTKVLKDLGYVDFDEPFAKLVNQGVVTLGGEAMSKSKGNIVDPLDVVPKYGVDALRAFILARAMPEKDLEWSDEGIEGIKRALDRITELLEFYKEKKQTNNTNNEKGEKSEKSEKSGERDEYALAKMNWLIAEYIEKFERLNFPSVIFSLFDFVKAISKHKEKLSLAVLHSCLHNLAILLNPITPYLSEHIWHEIGNDGYCSLAEMPKPNEALMKQEFLVEDNYIGSLIADIQEILELIKKKEKAEKEQKSIVVVIADNWKHEVAKLISNCKNVAEAIERIKQSQYANKLEEISKAITNLLNIKPLDEDKEYRIVSRNKEFLEKEFKAKVILLREKEAVEYMKYKEKAKRALPLKPVIIFD